MDAAADLIVTGLFSPLTFNPPRVLALSRILPVDGGYSADVFDSHEQTNPSSVISRSNLQSVLRKNTCPSQYSVHPLFNQSFFYYIKLYLYISAILGATQKIIQADIIHLDLTSEFQTNIF